jgi:hypothetical protein
LRRAVQPTAEHQGPERKLNRHNDIPSSYRPDAGKVSPFRRTHPKGAIGRRQRLGFVNEIRCRIDIRQNVWRQWRADDSDRSGKDGNTQRRICLGANGILTARNRSATEKFRRYGARVERDFRREQGSLGHAIGMSADIESQAAWQLFRVT